MFKSIAITAALVASVVAQVPLRVESPSGVVACQPTKITWQGGEPPYFLTFIPAEQPNATPLRSFPTTSDTELTWVADLPGGSTFGIALKDSTGSPVFSGVIPIAVNPSGETCETSNTEGSAVGGESTANPVAGATSSGASVASVVASATNSVASVLASTTGSGSAAAAVPTSGASRTTVGYVAAFMGLVGAALF